MTSNANRGSYLFGVGVLGAVFACSIYHAGRNGDQAADTQSTLETKGHSMKIKTKAISDAMFDTIMDGEPFQPANRQRLCHMKIPVVKMIDGSIRNAVRLSDGFLTMLYDKDPVIPRPDLFIASEED